MKRRILSLMLILFSIPAVAFGEETNYRIALEGTEYIYDGPGYDWDYARIVGEDGIFTIVAQQLDEEGNLWGRLKSGVGWVNLTARQQESYRSAPIRACFAQPSLLQNTLFYQYNGASGEDAVGIYIRPTRDLQLCSVYRMELTDWGMEPGKQYTAIQGMKAGMPMVLQVRFDGDMTAYGVTAVDMEGNVYRYVLSVSGRDGTLVLSQWP